MRLFFPSLVLATLILATSGIQFQLPFYSAARTGCYVYNVSAMLAHTWLMPASDGSIYLLSPPNSNILDAESFCVNDDEAPLVASPAYQMYGQGNYTCLALGTINQTALAPLNNDPTQGITVTLRGGQNTSPCFGYVRRIYYNLVCDPDAPPTQAPDSVTSGFVSDCVYTVTWRTALACPVWSSKTCDAPVPVPTAAQLRYQQNEIMALTHFNMATFFQDGDPACNAGNWNQSGNPASFAPTALDPANWVQSYQAVGAKEAVLTAKHGCGHLLWPSKVTIPSGEPYPYSVGRKNSYIQLDVLALFAAECQAAGIGHGFYYSLTDNFYLNVDRSQVQPGPLLPGQVNVTLQQFYDIAVGHITELWSNYGNLTEIWFDGGYLTDVADEIRVLLNKLQPGAVAFGGTGVSPNPIRWDGTEDGNPSYPTWSTGCDAFSGDPSAPDFCPAACDTTLQEGDTWFFVPGTPVRTLAELIPIYHSTAGQNGVLELDFAVDRTGRIDFAHAERYADFGAWIRSCYGFAVARTSGNSTQLTIAVRAGVPVDRVMIQENLVFGQRIRAYVVEFSNSTVSWQPFATGAYPAVE
eukprot:TRINITY_DN1125_c0_g1_i1.p1 TRINITY_DN1125_c0_g1~~TRINITY_DN1125_c0_g1_i1.p1  ORF type:complete len:636 (-),score=230.29 TRINITY_DN1125_c0_g1_i1:205-1947(-)